jgi:hypothetical protein
LWPVCSHRLHDLLLLLLLMLLLLPYCLQDRIQVMFEAPYYGMKSSKWMNSSQPPIIQKDLAGVGAHSGKTPGNGSKTRRLLQLQSVGTVHKTHFLSQQQSYQGYGGAAAAAAAAVHYKRMLKQQNSSITSNSTGQTSSSQTLAGLGFPGYSGLTPVWVVYTQLDPLNVTALLSSLSEACGGVEWKGGADVAGEACGAATRKALRSAGMTVDDARYQQMIIGKPVVSRSDCVKV